MRKKWIYLLLTACVLWSCAGSEEQTLVLNSEADLSGLRVATQSGSCYDVELSPRKDIELQRYNTLSDAIQALRHGNADVLLNDEMALNAYICREQGLKPMLRDGTGFHGGGIESLAAERRRPCITPRTGQRAHRRNDDPRLPHQTGTIN